MHVPHKKLDLDALIAKMDKIKEQDTKLEKIGCYIIRERLVETMQREFDKHSRYTSNDLIFSSVLTISAFLGAISGNPTLRDIGKNAYNSSNDNQKNKEDLSELWENTKDRIPLLDIYCWSEAMGVLNSEGFVAACTYLLNQKIIHGSRVLTKI